MIVHTGQHHDYEMSNVFFDQLEIPAPHYYLGVGSESHDCQSDEMIKRAEEILIMEKPTFITVYGDTNSTPACALATVKAGFKVVLVEAGLRSF